MTLGRVLGRGQHTLEHRPLHLLPVAGVAEGNDPEQQLSAGRVMGQGRMVDQGLDGGGARKYSGQRAPCGVPLPRRPLPKGGLGVSRVELCEVSALDPVWT